MKPIPVLKYFILITFLLSCMYFISSTYPLIPNIQRWLFIIIPFISLICGTLLITKLYKSYSSPIAGKQWFILTSLCIIIVGFIFFATFFSSISSKTDGLFTSYAHSYTFNDLTFYTYETKLMGTSTAIRYSENREWISHPIDGIWLRGPADDVHIVQKDTFFLISTQKVKFIFLPKSKKVIESLN